MPFKYIPNYLITKYYRTILSETKSKLNFLTLFIIINKNSNFLYYILIHNNII